MATNPMRRKHIMFLAASLLCGLAATATFTFAAPTTVRPADIATVQITLDKTTAVMSLADMAVGDGTRGTLRIENTGTSPATIRLSGSATGSADLAKQLMLTVYKDEDGVAGRRVFPVTGTAASLASFNRTGADLGYFDRPCAQDPGKACDSAGRPSQWSSGHRATLYLHVRLAGTGTDAGDNALALLDASETFTVTATKATGNGNRR